MRKTCKACGQNKDIEEFAVNVKSTDGRLHTCRECVSKNRRKGQRKARSKKVDPLLITLDLTDYADIMEALKQAAYANVRTVSEQALFFVVDALEAPIH